VNRSKRPGGAQDGTDRQDHRQARAIQDAQLAQAERRQGEHPEPERDRQRQGVGRGLGPASQPVEEPETDPGRGDCQE
jgi:hypothetical protein